MMTQPPSPPSNFVPRIFTAQGPPEHEWTPGEGQDSMECHAVSKSHIHSLPGTKHEHKKSLSPYPSVFIATKSPPTITKTIVPCGRSAAGALLSTMCMMTVLPPTSPAPRSVALSLLGILAPLTTALFHFKITLMPCAAQLETTTTLTIWSYSLSSCVGATTLGGASYYAPKPHFSFLWTASLVISSPLPHHSTYYPLC